MDIKKLCFELCTAAGVSGDENEAAQLACSLLSQYMPARLDALGNVIGEMHGEGRHILLDAHIDQIGLIVRGVDDNGFILFDRCGHADARVLTGSEVCVLGRERLYGVVCSVPPHLTKPEEKDAGIDIKKLAVDVGLCKDKARSLVSAGDRITLLAKPFSLAGSLICGGALDDRCCVAAILLCLDKLKKSGFTGRLTVMFTTREETGGSGAKTASFAADAQEAVAVDVGFGLQPGVEPEDGISLGKGVSIGISPTLDAGLTKRLVDVARRYSIPYQHDVMNGRTGTNCDEISVSRGGVSCALLSVPLKNMHTGAEIIDLNDIETTAKLLYRYILEGGGENA